MENRINISSPFIISSSSRSGTHLLSSLLSSTRLVGRVIDSIGLSDDSNDSEVLSRFEQLYERSKQTPSPSELWGLVVHAGMFSFFERWVEMVRIDLRSLKWIWLVRRDKFTQAISWVRAENLGIWTLTEKSEAKKIELNEMELEIDKIKLFSKVINSFFYDQMWETFFDRFGIIPHKLYYEDFVDTSVWDSVAAGALDFLEVPYQLPLNVSTKFLKQGAMERHKGVYRQLVNSVHKKLLRKYMPFDYEGLGMDTDNNLKAQ